MEKHIILGTAGHVDHGKTALIKALTNIDCDTHKEEKARGITINLGFSHLDLPSGDALGIIDVPGHQDFIKTMVAGAAGIHMVLLVIAADSGVMPQTLEHIRIIESLGISSAIVALTKSDLVDQEMLELATLEIQEFLEEFSFQNVPIIPVSAISGEGLDKILFAIAEMAPSVPARKSAPFFRMPIDRLFNVKGLGTVATGSVIDGQTVTGATLYLLPGNKKPVKVRGIERHGKPVDKITFGDRAALNLSGLKAEDFSRGMVLSDQLLEASLRLDAHVFFFAENERVGIWSSVIFLSGTFESMARMHLLDRDKLKKGEKAIVQLLLEKPGILHNGDKFIFRNSSNTQTLGGGTVMDNNPLHHRKRTPALLASLKDLVDANVNDSGLFLRIKIELRKNAKPLPSDAVARILGVSEQEITSEVQLNREKEVLIYTTADRSVLIHFEHHQQNRQAIVDELKGYHQDHFLMNEGLTYNELLGKLNFRDLSETAYLQALLEEMIVDGVLEKAGNTWKLSEHIPRLSATVQNDLEWLEEAVKSWGFQLPVLKQIEEQALQQKIRKDVLKMYLNHLVNQRKLQFINGNYIHLKCLNNCRKLLLKELLNRGMGINEKDFRLQINGSKSFVQAVLSFFLNDKIVEMKTIYYHLTKKGEEEARSYENN
jgi:selenocysteine-specific elongation factor